MIDIEYIRNAIVNKKKSEGLTITGIAQTAGIHQSAVYTFLSGGTPNLFNLIKIAKFCGINNLSGGVVCDGNTLENVLEVIFADNNLTDRRKKLLWEFFFESYKVFTTYGQSEN